MIQGHVLARDKTFTFLRSSESTVKPFMIIIVYDLDYIALNSVHNKLIDDVLLLLH